MNYWTKYSFHKKKHKYQITIFLRFKIPCQWGNENWNYFEIPPHSRQKDCHQEIWQQMSERVWGQKNLIHCCGMQINTAMMEISMDGPQKAETRPTREPSFPTAGHVSRELHLLPQRYPAHWYWWIALFIISKKWEELNVHRQKNRSWKHATFIK